MSREPFFAMPSTVHRGQWYFPAITVKNGAKQKTFVAKVGKLYPAPAMRVANEWAVESLKAGKVIETYLEKL